MIKTDSHGGYITSWIVTGPAGKNIEIFYQGTSLKRTGIPPLFPCWSDSGTRLRRHGFARDVEWKVIKKEPDEILMSLDSRTLNDVISEEYPGDFSININAKSENNNFYYSMKVKNRGQEDLAIAPAIHPYFAVNHNDKNKIDTVGIPGFKAPDFNWDTTPPDNNYPYSMSARIILPDREIEISDISATPVIKYMVVWSQPRNSSDFNFVCFEPLTALSGSIKRREIAVKPGKSWEMKLKFTARFC